MVFVEKAFGTPPAAHSRRTDWTPNGIRKCLLVFCLGIALPHATAVGQAPSSSNAAPIQQPEMVEPGSQPAQIPQPQHPLSNQVDIAPEPWMQRPTPGPKTLFHWAVGPKDTEEKEPDEDESLITDRPHFSEASALVGKGRFQVESGYTFSNDGGQINPLFGGAEEGTRGIQSHSFPETLFRIGVLADWFEFRLGYNYLVESTINADRSRTRVRGSDDLYVGAKLALTEQKGYLPEMAIFPQALVPSGSPAFTSGQALPGFNLAYSWKVNDWLEIECNTQLNRRKDDVQHFYTEFIQTLNLEYQFTKKFGGFTEWFAFMPNGSLAAIPQHYANGGFVYLVTKDIQLDIHAAVGLNRHADDFFGGGGLSVRF